MSGHTPCIGEAPFFSCAMHPHFRATRALLVEVRLVPNDLLPVFRALRSGRAVHSRRCTSFWLLWAGCLTLTPPDGSRLYTEFCIFGGTTPYSVNLLAIPVFLGLPNRERVRDLLPWTLCDLPRSLWVAGAVLF